MAEQPKVVSTLTTEDIFNPVSAESTRLRDEFGGDFKEIDEQVAGRNGASEGDVSSGHGSAGSGDGSSGESKQLVGVGAGGGNGGTLGQAAEVSSSLLRNVANTGIEPSGSDSGRPGNEIADDHGSGGNDPNLQDHTPVANNQGEDSAARGSDHAGPVEGISRPTASPVTQTSVSSGNLDPAASGSGPGGSHGPDRGQSGNIPNDGQGGNHRETVTFSNETAPLKQKAVDSLATDAGTKGLHPHPKFSEEISGLKPNHEYVRSGPKPPAAKYYTDENGNITDIVTELEKPRNWNPDLRDTLPGASYHIGDDTRITTNQDGNPVLVEANLKLGDAHRGADQGPVGRIRAPEIDNLNNIIKKENPGRIVKLYEFMKWNGGHLLAKVFGGGAEKINMAPCPCQ